MHDAPWAWVRYVPRMTPSSPDAPTGRHIHIYLIAAHPRWRDSRVNRQLLTTVREAAADAMGAVTIDINDLYASYPDYAIDTERERERLERADLLVLMHPIHWYSMPPLQKPLVAGRRGYHVREGVHNLTPYDWERFLDFAQSLWN